MIPNRGLIWTSSQRPKLYSRLMVQNRETVVKTHHGSLFMISRWVVYSDERISPKKRFEWTCLEEYRVDVIEINEICVNLYDPVRPAELDGDDVEH